MILKLTSAESELTLDERFKINIGSYKVRVGIQPRYGRPGGVLTGDKHIDPRQITLTFTVAEEDDQSYIEIFNDLAGFFQEQAAPFYLVDTENSRRIEVSIAELANSFSQGLEYRVGQDNSLQLLAVDSYWEDLTETDDVFTAVSNGAEFTVTNSGKLKTYPVITFATSISNPDFYLLNQATGESFRIGSLAFLAGTQIIVDSVLGTVQLEDSGEFVDISVSLADGSGFISLAPGANVFIYESSGAAVDVTVSYRRKFAY
jgi:hypothetical protein